MMASTVTSVLFVCLGNICRSPLAESIFRHLVRERGVEHLFEIDSAGTSDFHEGHPPDPRSASTARARGVEVTGCSRPILAEDLHRWDYVIVMDADNHSEVARIQAATGGAARVRRLREWDPQGGGPDVPDPYYDGARGFEDVHDIVERSCAALLEHLLDGEGEAA